MTFARVTCDAAIIGAGASGLFCAMTAGRRGRSVILFDHAPRPGAKILASGGGRCNFTNLDMDATRFASQNPHFCKSALARFTPHDFLDLLEKHDIGCTSKKPGQLFCTGTSRQILDMLVSECRAAGVRFALNRRIRSVERTVKGFTLRGEEEETTAAALVVATGGLSWPHIGATGFGYALARTFGLDIVPCRPGLVPFVWQKPERERYAHLSGISLPVSIRCGERRFRDDMLFTHQGLSGPAVLQVSSHWKPGEELHIDLLPGKDIGSMLEEHAGSNAAAATVLRRFLPRRLVERIGQNLDLHIPVAHCSKERKRDIAAAVHALRVTPERTEGFRKAEVTVGGVDVSALSSKTMQVRNRPGLYFIGEVLDVTGELGGYNLHWAWASGFAAGSEV